MEVTTEQLETGEVLERNWNKKQVFSGLDDPKEHEEMEVWMGENNE